jgi:hypothetical protein
LKASLASDLGKQTSQKLHNFWSHNYIVKRIKERGEEYMILQKKYLRRGHQRHAASVDSSITTDTMGESTGDCITARKTM